MGFWIFMLLMNLMIPLTMIGFGRSFMKNTPKEINAVFGYRKTKIPGSLLIDIAANYGMSAD